MNRLLRSSGLIGLGWLIGSCGGDGVTGPPQQTTAVVTLSSLTGTLVPSETTQLSATAKDAAGEALSRTFNWSSSNPSTATVSSSGMVTGVAPGTATITAAVDGKSAASTMTILDGGVVSQTGDTLNLRSGDVRIVVPPDALSSATDISVAPSTVYSNDSRVVKGTPFDFGPSGTTFAKPVSITIKYQPSNLPPGTEEKALEIHLATAAGWQVVQGAVVDSVAKTVTAQVSHFSVYAILTPLPVAAVSISGPAEHPISNGASNLIVGDQDQLAATATDAEGNKLENRSTTWSTSDATIASITPTGLVAALKPGSVTVTATVGGISSNVNITVAPVPVATVNVTLSSSSITAVETAQASATALDATGKPLTGRSIAWSSTNTAVATVDANGVVSAVAPGTANIAATSEGKTGSAALTVTSAPVASVSVTPASAALVLGTNPTQQLTAVTKDGNGNTLTGRVLAWTSDNAAVAMVNASGLVTAVGAGSATITVTSEGKSGSAAITVNVAPVASVTVALSSSSITAVGASQASATTRDASGNILTGRSVTWTSDNVAVATVDANGAVTAVAPGTVNIIATSEGKSGSAALTVSQAPVATVNVSLAANSISASQTTQATATLLDSKGRVLTGRTVAWSSDNAGAATVSATAGMVTAVSPGTANIIATTEGKTGSAPLTVTQDPVAAVTVSSPTSPMIVGQTQQLTALTKDGSGNVLTGRVVTWTSSNTSVLTVGSSGSPTTVTAVGAGSATITATSEAVSSAPTASITVNPVPVATVTVTPSSASLVLGITPTQQLMAVTKDASGNALTGRVVTWSSSNTAAATVDANGLVTAVAAGSATITGTSEGKTGTSSVTVSVAPVASVAVALSPTSVVAGGTSQATATTRDANGNVLTGRAVSWSSDNTAVANVDASGHVTTVSTGTANIIAISEGKTGSAQLTVTAIPVASVVVSPSSASLVLAITPTQQLTAATKDANGNTLTGRAIVWNSDNTAVATVSATGLVTAVSPGSATVTATSEGKTGTATITVGADPVASVSVSLSPNSITTIGTSQATATLKDANGTTLTGRAVVWSSDNSAIATVTQAGVVTAIAAGTANIIATSEGRTGAATITVTPAPVATVTVALAPSSITAVGTSQATATTRDANGNVLTGRTVAWTSDNSAVATVSATGVVTAVSAGIANIIATSEGKTGSAVLTVTQAPVATVTVTPSSANLVIGVTPTQQLTAVTKDANGNTLTGRVVMWSSNNAAAATVDANGLVTAVSAGSATITATSEGKTGASSITATVAPVATVTVTLASNSITAVGSTQANATLRDANGNVLSGRTVTWNSDNTAVATVSSTTGLVTAVAAGTANIIATSEGKTGSAPLTVTAAPVATVTVSPATATLVLGSTPTQQLTAVTKDANGNTLTGRVVTWSSSNTAAATVDANGLVTAVAAGSATVTATSEGKTGTSSITVTVAPVATVIVTLSATSITAVETSQATATTRDANGNVLTGRTLTWSSDNTAVASVDVNGVVTAIAAGSANIIASSEGKTGSATITITEAPVATVNVSLSPSTINAVQISQATATLLDAKGRTLTGRTVTWSSDNTAIATVSATSGLVTAVAPGTANIIATSEGKTGSALLTVTPAPVATVTVTPPSASLVPGITPTQQLTAVTKDAKGNTLTGRVVTWASSNAAVATVDANGLVTAVTAGTVTITATSEGQSGTSSITVNLAPVATVNVTLSASSITAVGTSQATATTLDANGNTLTGRTVTWSSDNTAVATVDANGLVTAVAVGTANVIATSEGKTGSAAITITQAPVATVSVSLNPSSINAIQTSQATATLLDAKGRTLTGRTVTWSSDNTAVATVSSTTGVVTAVSAGTANIIATSEGKTGSAQLTVTQAPVASVTVTPSSATMVAGNTQQLTATLRDAHNTTLTNRTVTWSSDNTAVATVDGNGLVTAVTAGAATITATSEGVNGTSSITVNSPTTTASLLHVSASNRRYFENASGQVVYLTGSHTWSNLQDNGTVDPPPAFDYNAYLDFLTSHHHNFFRLWAWEQAKWTAEISSDYWITPGPFLRTGPDTALDGKPKFDLTQFDQTYFDRLRARVQAAGARGIYVSVMLFDGWSVATKGGFTSNNPWHGHPFNVNNNINGIDGDTNGDDLGLEVQTLGNSAVTALQEAYVRRVIDAVGDLDNVLYEIDNEGDPSSRDWQYHMIQVIRDYEATKPKQHPIGMTPMYPNGSDTDLFNSTADWIADTDGLESPKTSSGAKVLISDTDHICGVCGSTSWVWKNFVKGQNPILMDGYDGAAIGLGAENYSASDTKWEPIRNNMGYARDYSLRMDLAAAVPHGDKVVLYNGSLAQTGYCLAKPGSQYLVYLPDGGNVTMDLTEVTGTLSVEWFNPATGIATQAGTTGGGSSVTLTAPFSGPAVLFVH